MVGKKSIAKKPTKKTQIQSPAKKIGEGESQQQSNNDFLSDNFRDLYFSNYARRKFADSRRVDLGSFDENNAEFVREWFKFQGWEWLVDQDLPIYPNLVHLFYTHFDEANKKPNVIDTWVKGKTIRLDAKTLGEILHIPSSGIQIEFKQTWGKFEGISSKVCSQVLLEDSESRLKRPGVDELPLQSRLLLLFLQCTFIARRGRKSSLSTRDMKTMYCILKLKKINMAEFMIKYMIKARNNKRKCCLPYPMWLTLVFKHFDVNLNNEVELDSGFTPFTIRTITIDLRYGYDEEAEAWTHLGVRRAPKRKAVDMDSQVFNEQTGDDFGEKTKVESELEFDDSANCFRRAMVESLVVQEMLRRLHPDYFTTETIADIRATAVQIMTEQENVHSAKTTPGDNESEAPIDEEKEDEDKGEGNYESSDEDD